MAEWLGNGLQNRVQQFESAWNLEDGRRLVAICRFFGSQIGAMDVRHVVLVA